MHAIWKAAILGATLGRLSITSAGKALADTPHIAPPVSVTAPDPIDAVARRRRRPRRTATI